MWAVVVEARPPSGNEITGMAEVVEQVFVQAFVMHPAVEAFDKPVLLWLAGRDVMLVNLAIFLPLQDRIGSQFGPIVTDHPARVSTHLSDPIQFTRNAITRQRRINHSGQTSRLKSSITFRMRNLRPHERLSDTKSSDHRWFGPCGIAMGVLVPTARLRPPRLRTVNPSSR